MRTRLLLAAGCILILPLLFSASPADKLTNSTPFATVVLAGHILTGGWCECGTLGCICDPGENPGGTSATPLTDNESSDQRLSPIRAHSSPGFDFGSGALILALALFMWARLRA